MEPPRRLKIGEVPAYVAEQGGDEPTRQTVYNWAKKGVNGVRLRTIRKFGSLVTTENWVDDFLANLKR